jgi:uncharacterized protein
MTGRPEVVVLVLAKAPVAGVVKTRLCPPATPEEAAALAAACFLDTMDTVLSLPWALPVVALSGDLRAAHGAAEVSARLAGVATVPQRGDGLAERLVHAHHDAHGVGEGLPVLQIGADTPQVSEATLALGARLLTARYGPQSVLGPATDGGWWALGLRRPEPSSVLRTVAMSRADTGIRTVEALKNADVEPELLPELSDVDYSADALEVAARIPGSRFATALAGMVWATDHALSAG